MSTYSYLEVESMLASGDVRGRLLREDLPTPALLLDLDAFEANVSRMLAHCRTHGLSLRPHGKTHKCPEIANRMIAAGAIGACVSKVSEAAAFTSHGVRGVLITTPIVTRYTIERAISLTRTAEEIMFVVDDPSNARLLDAAAVQSGIIFNVVIDLHVGLRGGVLPGAPALDLARTIQSGRGLRLCGIQAYVGYASHICGYERRCAVSDEALAPARQTLQLFHKHGIECRVVSGGSTGTYDSDARGDLLTELQAGSFIFMDIDYARIGGPGDPVYRDFRPALSVLTTVVSKPTRDLAVIDGGTKAFSADRPYVPEARNGEGIVFAWGGDEHGKLDLQHASVPVELGDRIEFLVPHCDPTVNLYDRMYCMRGNLVEEVWPIVARGMSQ